MIAMHSLNAAGRPNTFDIPGVDEYALFVKNVNDAVVLRRAISDRLERANLPHLSEEERKRLLHVVVVGGGPTGRSNVPRDQSA